MPSLSPPPLPPRTPSGASTAPTRPLPGSPTPSGGVRTLPPALPARPSSSSPAQVRSPSSSSKKVVVVEEKRIVEAMDNEALGVLLRRFNKQTHHLHIVPLDPPRISSLPPLLDLQPSPEELFSADKLRSNLERFYASVVVGMMRFVKEIFRLRSWAEGERTRTGLFLGGYILAWYFNVLTASLLSFLSLLILVPSTRLFFFPPQAITIEISSPSTVKASPLPSNPTDPTPSTPGGSPLPESVSHREVGVERMAGDFADGLEAVLASAATQADEEEDEFDTALTEEDAEEVIVEAVEGGKKGKGKKKEKGVKLTKKAKKAAKKKEKKEKVLDKHGRPVMLIVGDLADGWERWANALSPTAPFGSSGRRSVVLSIFLPIIISTSGIFSEYVFSRVVGGFLGFLFFGQPILDRLAPFLEAKIPNWQEKMELRNGILAGVPTNAQLALRLLRDAELRFKPLPPPGPPPAQVNDEFGEDDDTEASEEFAVVDQAGEEVGAEDGASIKSATSAKKAKGEGKAKFASFIKSAAKFTEESAGYVSGQKQFDWEKVSRGALDRLNVSPSNAAAKSLLAIIPNAPVANEDTPSTFFVNHSGRPGHIIVQRANPKTNTPARIVFTTVGNVSEKDNYAPQDPGAPPNSGNKGKLTIPINDLVEVRKHGMGWQSRMFMSWAMGLQGVGGTGLELKVRRRKTREVLGPVSEVEAEAADGEKVELQVEEEETFKFGAIVRRDELFCRLLALGDQRWEAL